MSTALEISQERCNRSVDLTSDATELRLSSETLSESSVVVFVADTVQTWSRASDPRNTNDAKLSGSIKLNVAQLGTLKTLASDLNNELQIVFGSDATADAAEPQWIEFDVSGSSYSDYRCQLRGELPVQFVESLTLGALQPLEDQRLAYEKQLEEQLTLKRNAIRTRIEKSAELAQQQLSEHRDSLASMRTDLEKSPQFREGVAKLPNTNSATR